MQAAKVAGLGFSEDGHTFGITAMLKRLLQNTGYDTQSIHEKSSPINFSAGEEAHQGMYRNSMAFFQLAQPSLIEHKVATKELLEDLYPQMLQEMHSSGFCGMTFFLTVWGINPPSAPVEV